MKVLMISSDRKILDPGSSVRNRMVEIGNLVEELHIIILSDKSHGLVEEKISPKVWVYPTNSLNKFLRSFDAIKIGRKINCSLITTQDPFECGWAGMRLKVLKKVPLEVQLHTDPFSIQFRGFLNLIRKLIMRSVFNQANAVRVVLSSVGKKLRSHGVKNVYTIPIYIDKSKINSEPKFNLHDKYSFKHIALAVSRLTGEKNLSLAIESISLAQDWCLVIVGSGQEEYRLKSLAKGLGVYDRVKFEGWQEDLASYYKTADAFVQTSKYEGYGLSLVEAGLSGLPAISTPVGVAVDLENVILSQDAVSISQSLDRLLKDDQNRDIGIRFKNELQDQVLDKDSYLTKIKENWLKLC